jgi:hypothetical protein
MPPAPFSLVFISGCLEPGRDGVGDYTRTLAAECARRGHRVGLLSLAEPGPATDGPGDGLPSLRLTPGQWREGGGARARRWLGDFSPDWACLQFVPYSFDRRGLFRGSIGPLADLLGAARRRQIFFHEIWIGSQVGAPLKARLIGWRQRSAVRELLGRLAPDCVHTSTGYYRDALATLGRRASILPMLGSVPDAGGEPLALPEVPAGALVCGHFGTLHPGWQPGDFLADFAALAASLGRPAALVAAGGLGPGEPLFRQVAAEWEGRVKCLSLGRLDPGGLSRAFARFDLAVTSVPWNLRGKSSSAAALREHGLRVAVTAAGSPPRFARAPSAPEESEENFVPYFRDHALLRSALGKTTPSPGARACAAQLLADLHAAS